MADPSVPPAAAASCFDCDYDLRGLPPPPEEEPRCPECGTAVAESAEKYERLVAWGGVAPVRRGTFWVLIAFGVALAAGILGAIIGVAADYRWWSYRVFDAVMPAVFAAATLFMAVSAWRAAGTLRKTTPPGERLAGRVLTLAAWVLPAGTAVMWGLVWFDARGRLAAGQVAVGMVIAAAGVVFVPAFVWVLYNRVRLWPRAVVLPRLLRLTTLVMVVGLALTVPVLTVFAVEAATGESVTFEGPVLYGRLTLADAMQTAAGAGWLAFALSVPLSLLLVASVFGRVGKLAKSLAVPAVASGEEVRKEGQPPAIVAQGVEVDGDAADAGGVVERE